MLSATGLSVLIGFLYRYYSLKSNLKFFHSRRAIVVITVAVILYPVPSLIPNWLQYRFSEEDTQEFIQTHYPDLFDIYTHWTCSGFYDDICFMSSMILALIQIFFVGILAIYYAVKCIKLLNSVKHSLTASTYALQKQLLYILCFQMMIPVICLILPTSVLFIAMLTGSRDMGGKERVYS